MNQKTYGLNTHIALISNQDGSRPKFPEGLVTCDFEVFGTEEEIVKKLLNSLLTIMSKHISDENKTDMQDELVKLRQKYTLRDCSPSNNDE